MADQRGTSSYLTLAVLLAAALVVVAVAFGMYVYDVGLLPIRVAYAEEQTEIFDEMRARAVAARPAQAVGYLDYAANYYPSGSKQLAGSRLDRIVERARANAVREIIASLRQKTGKDFGDDPARWIEEYGDTGK